MQPSRSRDSGRGAATVRSRPWRPTDGDDYRGYVVGPEFDRSRAIDFTHRSARVREVATTADGNLVRQIFYPHVPGSDPATLTIWQSDPAMSAFAYRSGLHREMIARHKRISMLDRTSFTRLRAVRTSGTWEGRDPEKAALGQD